MVGYPEPDCADRHHQSGACGQPGRICPPFGPGWRSVCLRGRAIVRGQLAGAEASPDSSARTSLDDGERRKGYREGIAACAWTHVLRGDPYGFARFSRHLQATGAKKLFAEFTAIRCLYYGRSTPRPAGTNCTIFGARNLV